MTATVAFPDAELVCVDYLVDELALRDEPFADDVAVGTRKPSPMPHGPVIQVRRVGGLRQTVVTDQPRIDLLVWHSTDKNARDLTELARALLCRPAREGGLEAEEFAGPTRFADPDSDQPRWLLTVEFVLRGTPLTPAGS